MRKALKARTIECHCSITRLGVFIENAIRFFHHAHAALKVKAGEEDE